IMAAIQTITDQRNLQGSSCWLTSDCDHFARHVSSRTCCAAGRFRMFAWVSAMPPQLAVLVAAALATIGGVWTARRARNIARKQHTINVILQGLYNSDYRSALQAIVIAHDAGSLPDLNNPENVGL